MLLSGLMRLLGFFKLAKRADNVPDSLGEKGTRSSTETSGRNWTGGSKVVRGYGTFAIGIGSELIVIPNSCIVNQFILIACLLLQFSLESSNWQIDRDTARGGGLWPGLEVPVLFGHPFGAVVFTWWELLLWLASYSKFDLEPIQFRDRHLGLSK